jgi:hypothetical protein
LTLFFCNYIIYKVCAIVAQNFVNFRENPGRRNDPWTSATM